MKIKAEDQPTVAFKLYMNAAANEDRSRMIETIESVCASVYGSIDSFEVLDEEAAEACERTHAISVWPTLLRISPGPARRYFGDLSDPARLQTLLSDDRRVKLD